MGAFWAHK